MENSFLIIIAMALISAFAIQSCDRSSNQMERAETSVIEAERDVEIAISELQSEIRTFNDFFAPSTTAIN